MNKLKEIWYVDFGQEEKEVLNELKELDELGYDLFAHGNHALVSSVRKGYFRTARYLIRKGADLKINNDKIIETVCKQDDIKMIMYMIDRGSTLNSKAFSNLCLFRENRHTSKSILEVIEHILKSGVEITNDAFTNICLSRNKNIIKQFLEHGARINQDSFKNICLSKDEEMIMYFLKYGATVSTDIMEAAIETGNFELVNFLISFRDNREDHEILLDSAFRYEHANIFKHLMNKYGIPSLKKLEEWHRVSYGNKCSHPISSAALEKYSKHLHYEI